MGLDTTHECWHGPYSSFTRWRDALAKAAGYETIEVDGRPTTDIDWESVRMSNLEGDWPETPADPLLVIIAHYDCEGHIVPRDALPIAERLEELMPLLEDGYQQQLTKQFATGLRDAAKAGETVEFG